MPFLANSFRSNNTTLLVYSANPPEQTVVAMVADETEETQEITSEREEVRPEVRIHCGEMMEFIDNAVGTCSHRKIHWTSVYIIWVYAMLLVVNARKLCHSSSGLDPGKSVGECVHQVIRVHHVTGCFADHIRIRRSTRVRVIGRRGATARRAGRRPI